VTVVASALSNHSAASCAEPQADASHHRRDAATRLALNTLIAGAKITPNVDERARQRLEQDIRKEMKRWCRHTRNSP
jgi:hypothetical protein